MHELNLVLNIIEIAEEQAKVYDAHRVESIVLEIGKLAGVEIDAFEFAWEAAVPNTVLEKADCIIQPIQAKARCLGCGLEYDISQLFDPCPHCREYLNELLQGKELRLKSLVVN